MTNYHVAKTIAAVAESRSRNIKQIMDRSKPLSEKLVMSIVSKTQCHFAGRKPRRPGLKPSDMDLASYLLPMWKRRAALEILQYSNRLQVHKCESEYRVHAPRFGNLEGLVSHQRYLSFGVMIKDHSVVREFGNVASIGQPRSLLLVDYDGTWHTLPSQLYWRPRSDENDFNNLHHLCSHGVVSVGSFVHLNRRESIFGAPYLHLKLLHERLVEECRFYGRSVNTSTEKMDKVPVGEVCSEIVPTFEVKLKGPKRYGEYASTVDVSYQTELWRWRQLVQWLMRANELAFYLHGRLSRYTAPWIKSQTWEVDGSGGGSIDLHPKLQLRYVAGLESKKVAA